MIDSKRLSYRLLYNVENMNYFSLASILFEGLGTL